MSLEKFILLHNQEKPLLIANTWDATSTKAAEKAGFEIVSTSSHAIANMLGYEDGENIPFHEMFFIIEKVVKSTKLLVSADLESGYSEDPFEVAKNVEKLVDLGVLGINLEDGLTNGNNRTLGKIGILSDKIKAIKSRLKSKGKDIYINARIDTYTTKQSDAIIKTLERIKLYEEAGANGFFVPLINTTEDIQLVLNTTKLPLNVFMKGGLKSYDEFASLGVHRISYGNAIHAQISNTINTNFTDLLNTKTL